MKSSSVEDVAQDVGIAVLLPEDIEEPVAIVGQQYRWTIVQMDNSTSAAAAALSTRLTIVDSSENELDQMKSSSLVDVAQGVGIDV